MSPLVRQLLSIGVAVLLMGLWLRQCRKPWSLPGRFFIWMMDRSHAGVISWGLRQIDVAPQSRILDVGCGGGQAIRTLALPGRVVNGVDYASASVAAAKSRNADLLASGAVSICRASVSQLPFADSSFDIVTAIETHYYWPDPVNDFREVQRVLVPGGTFALIAETYRDQKLSALLVVPMLLLRARYLTEDEHRSMLAAAGFIDIQIEVNARKGWICARARRPEA